MVAGLLGLPLWISLAVGAVLVAFTHRQTCRQRRPVQPAQLGAIATIVQLVLAVPAGVATWLIWHVYHPTDDWDGLLGLCAGMFTAVAAVVVGLVVWNVATVYERRRSRWHAHCRTGYCINCGYDLTGNVSGRCPECGQVVQSQGT